jgi:Short C-terminal domain
MAFLLGIVSSAFFALLVSGCASTGTTLVRPDGEGQVIYRISEEEAFTIALDAYAALYPNKSVDDVVENRRRGYNADERSWAGDWWHHRILVIPAIGSDAGANEVHGYWYDYSGGGTFAPTNKRTTGLLQFIRARLDATGKGVVVTNVRDGQYETDGRAYLGLKRDARDIKLAPRPATPSNTDRLNELKAMRDKGLISEEEYQVKRRQILDRM